MFYKSCEYAIRAMLFVAQKSGNGNKTGIKEISIGIDAPEHFQAKIQHELSLRNIVQSIKDQTAVGKEIYYMLESTTVAAFNIDLMKGLRHLKQ